jgi:hypothetical protein
MQTFCRLLWCYCEDRNISLGRFAPWVFGGMLGRRPHKVKD